MMISGICEGVYIYSSCDGVVMERNPYGFWNQRVSNAKCNVIEVSSCDERT